jgi:hypothetical protein
MGCDLRGDLAEFDPDDWGQGKISVLENADFLMRLELVKDAYGVVRKVCAC